MTSKIFNISYQSIRDNLATVYVTAQLICLHRSWTHWSCPGAYGKFARGIVGEVVHNPHEALERGRRLETNIVLDSFLGLAPSRPKISMCCYVWIWMDIYLSVIQNIHKCWKCEVLALPNYYLSHITKFPNDAQIKHINFVTRHNTMKLKWRWTKNMEGWKLGTALMKTIGN